jgi:hypothetical protein
VKQKQRSKSKYRRLKTQFSQHFSYTHSHRSCHSNWKFREWISEYYIWFSSWHPDPYSCSETLAAFQDIRKSLWWSKPGIWFRWTIFGKNFLYFILVRLLVHVFPTILQI